VSQTEVSSLPMNGRNFLDLALLVPGVSPTNVASTQLFAETSAVPGGGLSVGSQRNFSNNFIVDGLSANDDAAGLSGIPYRVDAVDQFQVVTSGRPGGTGTRPGRLRQRRDEKRHERGAWRCLQLPMDPIGPAVSISGVVTAFGTLSGSPTGRLNRMYEVVDNVSHQVGAHALRAGADFLHNDATITFPRSIRGSYAFSSLANFLSGVYNNGGFTQTFGATVASQTNPSVGFYGQDEWKVGPRLTLNVGLRYDVQFLQTIHTDTNNLAPRAGFAWSPSESRRTLACCSAIRPFRSTSPPESRPFRGRPAGRPSTAHSSSGTPALDRTFSV